MSCSRPHIFIAEPHRQENLVARECDKFWFELWRHFRASLGTLIRVSQCEMPPLGEFYAARVFSAESCMANWFLEKQKFWRKTFFLCSWAGGTLKILQSDLWSLITVTRNRRENHEVKSPYLDWLDFSSWSETFRSLTVVKRTEKISNERNGLVIHQRGFIHVILLTKLLLFCRILFFLQCWHFNLFNLSLALLTSEQSFELIFSVHGPISWKSW